MPTAALASVARVLRLNADTFEEAVEAAAAILLRGGVVALPTDTLYGISTLIPYSDRLYALKKRPYEKPLGIFIPSPQSVPLVARQTISDKLAYRLLPGPVTLVFERLPALPPDFNPGVSNVGVRVPDSAIVAAICRKVGQPLAQTSANISGSSLNPTCLEDFEELIPLLDLVIDGGEIQSGSHEGSTIVDLSVPNKFKIIRDGCAKKRTEEVLREFGLDEL
ncbi:unnamed protein product [Caenorhabditis bovis]|uniref:Threonylcarbamoyl-AMP synthase n=1 Tax=Caenorhabditis bovis TaxID=2654633 RepID=A0A8S1FET6_9PELO|nr:unnamed protein product [Caenorhabditis bovis]